MGTFSESMASGCADLISTIPSLPFLTQSVDGTISDEHFRRFTEQNYLRLREFERFLAVLSSRAPEKIRRDLSRSILTLHSEIENYEELAARFDMDLSRLRMTFACHAITSFLHATASMR